MHTYYTDTRTLTYIYIHKLYTFTDMLASTFMSIHEYYCS